MNPIKVHRGPISGKVREVALKHVVRVHWDEFIKDGKISGLTITLRMAPRWHAHTFAFLNDKLSYQKKVFTPKGWKTTKYWERSSYLRNKAREIKAVDFK